MKIVERDGPGALTLKRLGDALGVDSTALYRHLRSKEELLSAIGDQLLEGYIPDVSDDVPWRDAVWQICVRLRAAYLARPAIADLVCSGAPQQGNELRLTELLLRLLRRGGLDPVLVASGYHALISLTLGAAAIDAPVASQPERERELLYRVWRRRYSSLSAAEYPVIVDFADRLWAGTADDRFREALAIMLDGLEARGAASGAAG